ncbi:ankyrin repeat domain-containing protein [Candidatus Babeliales bacterium]|nr:ankyrin repeat domain-containing protein [Candidatus Babeliales bacterium]
MKKTIRLLVSFSFLVIGCAEHAYSASSSSQTSPRKKGSGSPRQDIERRSSISSLASDNSVVPLTLSLGALSLVESDEAGSKPKTSPRKLKRLYPATLSPRRSPRATDLSSSGGEDYSPRSEGASPRGARLGGSLTLLPPIPLGTHKDFGSIRQAVRSPHNSGDLSSSGESSPRSEESPRFKTGSSSAGSSPRGKSSPRSLIQFGQQLSKKFSHTKLDSPRSQTTSSSSSGHVDQEDDVDWERFLMIVNNRWELVEDRALKYPLHWAVRENKIELVTKLIKQERKNPAYVNAGDEHGLTPLHYAAINGDLPIFSLLLAAGAHPNCQNVDGFTPLHAAVYNEVNWRTLNEFFKVAEELFQKSLHEYHDEEAARTFLLNVDAVSHNGTTPLHLAVRSQNMQIIQLLLSIRKANINLRDYRGMTALHRAIYYHNHTAAMELLSHYDNKTKQLAADVNCPDNKGFTPLDYAENEKMLGVAMRLKELKAEHSAKWLVLGSCDE